MPALGVNPLGLEPRALPTKVGMLYQFRVLTEN